MDITQAELDWIVRKITDGIKKELRATRKKVDEVYTFLFRNGFKARVENIERMEKANSEKLSQYIEMREISCPHGDAIAGLIKDSTETKKRHTSEDAIDAARGNVKSTNPNAGHWRRRDDLVRLITAGSASLALLFILLLFVGLIRGWW